MHGLGRPLGARGVVVAAGASVLMGWGAATAAAQPPAEAPATISFCATSEHFPMTRAGTPPGFELEVARAIAARLEAQVRFTWLHPFEDDFERAVLDGRCDAALGAIGALTGSDPTAGAHAPPGLRLSAPYQEVAYRLISRSGARAVRTLADLGETRVAVEGESVVVYTLRQRGRRVHVLDDYDAVIAAVADGRAEYGYVWGPVAGPLLRERRDVALVSAFTPVDRWGLSLALRARDDSLRRAVDGAVRQLVSVGAVERIAERYHLACCDAGRASRR